MSTHALAPSSHRMQAVTARHALGALRRVTMFVALLASCAVPPTNVEDASTVDAPPPGIPGTVALRPASMEGPMGVELFALRIASIRLVGDRGPALDHEVDGTGLVTIGATELDIPVGDVPPALYSAVVLTLANGPDHLGEPVLEIRMPADDGRMLDIAITEPMTLVVRCAHGALVSTTGALNIAVDFALGDPLASLMMQTLPAPSADGVVHITEATAPDTIAAFRADLMDRVHADCSGSDGM